MNGSTSSQDGKSSALSPFFFGALILLCIAMIGGTGYAKLKLDRIEATLAAPDSALSADQDLADRTMHALGYGGFLGNAQAFISARNDQTALQDMKQNLKTAKESVIRIGDKASAATRHDIESIIALFQSVMDKADARDGIAAMTSADLLTAASALPMLDTRLQAALAGNRFIAQDSYKSWSLAVTCFAWFGLILSSVLAASLSMAIRKKHTGPIKSLINSINHVLSNDLQVPVWGTERNDLVGELARSLDLARQRFGQIPDISLMSDQGPVRMKFDGESRSLFQALTRSMRDDHERLKLSANAFAQLLDSQQKQLGDVVSKLNDAQTIIQKNGAMNDASIKALSRSLAEATKNMAAAQDAAVAQIAKVVPFMQDRAKNMAEITSLAGTQVTQSLSTLVRAEQNLRGNAQQSQQAIVQLSNTTNQLGERLFGAINLLQASGKALGDVTDAAQSRFNEAVETLGRGEDKLQTIILRAEERLNKTVNAEENMASLAARTEKSAEKMESAVRTMAQRTEQLEDQTHRASDRMEAIVVNFEDAQRSLTDAVAHLRDDGDALGDLLGNLRANNDDLLATLDTNTKDSHATIQSLAERSHALMQRLELQIEQQSAAVTAKIDELMVHSRTVSHQSEVTTEGLAATIDALKSEQDKITETRSRFSETLEQLGEKLERETSSAFSRTESMASQSYDQLKAVTEQMESVVQKLTILGQLTGTLGTVAGQLGQLVPALTQTPLPAGAVMPALMAQPADIHVDLPSADELSNAISASLAGSLTESLAGTLAEKIQTELHQALIQIEAMHDQLAQMVVQQKDQLETRLIVMDKKIKEAPEVSALPTDPKQTALISDIVSTLAKINDHVMELDEALAQESDDNEDIREA